MNGKCIRHAKNNNKKILWLQRLACLFFWNKRYFFFPRILRISPNFFLLQKTSKRKLNLDSFKLCFLKFISNKFIIMYTSKNIPFIILFILISWTLMVSQADDQNPDRARLLAEKQVLNKYLVENKDIMINYNIFNVGSRFVETKNWKSMASNNFIHSLQLSNKCSTFR